MDGVAGVGQADVDVAGARGLFVVQGAEVGRASCVAGAGGDRDEGRLAWYGRAGGGDAQAQAGGGASGGRSGGADLGVGFLQAGVWVGAQFDLVTGQLGAHPLTEFTGCFAHQLRAVRAEGPAVGFDQEELFFDPDGERGEGLT